MKQILLTAQEVFEAEKRYRCISLKMHTDSKQREAMQAAVSPMRFPPDCHKRCDGTLF